MVGPLKALTEKIKNFRFKEPQAKLSTNPWGQPETVRDVVTQSQRNIKKRFPAIQRSLRLYLCNKETEFILFRPIRVSYPVNLFSQMLESNSESNRQTGQNRLTFGTNLYFSERRDDSIYGVDSTFNL